MSNRTIARVRALLLGAAMTAVPTMVVALTSHAAPTATVEAVGGAANATATAVRVLPPGMFIFPMDPSPRCSVLNNFGDSRGGGRSHEGVDIAASLGQAVYAVGAGTVEVREVDDGSGATAVSLSGNYVRLTFSDGSKTFFNYMHLSAFGPGIDPVKGTKVTVSTGDVVGYVGDTGNPGPGNYHLHFEYHPKGSSSAVDPVPHLVIPASCKVYPR